MRRQPMSTCRRSAASHGTRYAVDLTDRCWALPFLVACVTLLYALPFTSGGLFYVLFMDKFNVNREAATWTKTIAWATSYIMGFAVGAIQDKVSTYNTLLLGSLLCPASLLASAFVPNIAWMCVTFGFFYGASFGILRIATSVYVVSYFDKYRSFATGIQHAGTSLSGVFGPSVLSILAAAYGLRGTFLLAGALTLNSFPLVLLFRNPRPVGWPRWVPWNVKRVPKVGTTVGSEVTSKTTLGASQNDSEDLDIPQDIHEDSNKQFTVMASEHTDLCKEVEHLENGGNPNFAATEIKDVPEDRQKSLGVFSQIFELLRAPSFYVIAVPIVVADFTLPLLGTTIIDYAGDKGVPLDTGALLLSCLSAGTLSGRLVISFISDKITRNRCITASATFAVMSLCFLVFPHINGSGVIAMVTFFAGTLQGYLTTIKSVLVADYLGVQRLAVSWGLIGLVSLPVTFCEPFIVGAFRDNGGSYDNFYRSCGAASIVAALLLLMQACLDARKRKDAHQRLHKTRGLRLRRE